MEQIDCIVVGAGVVGLAIARRLALAGREVVVLEAEARIGEHTSSRNSEVIHAGLHYRKGSLRQKLFPGARDKLLAYCADHGVPHKRVGKIMIARTEEEAATLRKHLVYAHESGVTDARWLEPAETRELEPDLVCKAAYLSPSSGIVDSHSLMLSYQGDLEARGGRVALRSPVEGGEISRDGVVLRVGGAEPVEVTTKLLINAAGHGSTGLARSLSGMPREKIPQNFYRRGVYFSVSPAPFKRLIYPIHGPGGMDIHAVVDLAGNVRFGPDSEVVDGIDYSVDAGRAAAFYRSIRSFWPGLADGALQPAYAGIRPSITPPGEQMADFRVDGPEVHGVPGLVNLFGIESPGLTASLALGDHVAALPGVGLA